MGAMTKRDVDILVMHLLCQYAKLPKQTNHFLSISLQVTESQVHRLRYEVDLKYPPKEEKYVEAQFLKILARSKFAADRENKKSYLCWKTIICAMRFRGV